MPITAQKTASCVTRGLVSAQYWAMRLGETVRVVMRYLLMRPVSADQYANSSAKSI